MVVLIQSVSLCVNTPVLGSTITPQNSFTRLYNPARKVQPFTDFSRIRMVLWYRVLGRICLNDIILSWAGWFILYLQRSGREGAKSGILNGNPDKQESLISAGKGVFH